MDSTATTVNLWPISFVSYIQSKIENQEARVNFLITTSNLGLTTANPYSNDENRQEVLTCADDETIKVKVDRFDTEASYDFLGIAPSDGALQSK